MDHGYPRPATEIRDRRKQETATKGAITAGRVELLSEEAGKAALHALIKRITAYPDRKMEVKFRIGEQVEKIAGGELDDPHHGIPYLSHEVA